MRDEEAAASEDDSELGGDGGGGAGGGAQRSKDVSFLSPLDDDLTPTPKFHVSALVRSISGISPMESRRDAGDEEREREVGWGDEEEEEGKPKSNGLRTSVPPLPSSPSSTVLPSSSSPAISSSSSSVACMRSRLQRLTTGHAKTDSLKRLSYLFSRSQRRAPPAPLVQSPQSYTISDGLLRPPGGGHGDLDLGPLGHVTRSETRLNEVGRRGNNNPVLSPRRTNGRDSLLALPLPPPCPCQSLHCASNISESSSRLLDSSEDVFEGGGVGGGGGGRGRGRGSMMVMGGWVGPCSDVIEDTCEVIEDSVTTQL